MVPATSEERLRAIMATLVMAIDEMLRRPHDVSLRNNVRNVNQKLREYLGLPEADENWEDAD